MQGNARLLSEKLNESLDDMDAPNSLQERTQILSKLLDVPKHLATALLQGQHFPDEPLLEKIYSELELDTQSLLS